MKKIKKLFSAALALTLGLTATFNLTACEQLNGLLNSGESQQEQSEQSDSSTTTCRHVFGEWTRLSGSTSCSESIFVRRCAECNYLEERKGTDADHVLSYEYDDTNHWSICSLCNEESEKSVHVEDGSGCCRFCACLIPSACVYYELSEDGTYAIVTGYDEMETDVVVVSSTYQNLPVKEIQSAAFEYCTSLASVVLPDTITTIGENAFNGCKNLMAVYLSKNVTTIGENAFNGCVGLTIFTAYDKNSTPAGWHANYNPNHAHIIGNHDGKRAANVSAKATQITDSMVRHEDSNRTQILANADLAGVRIPVGFSKLTRFDRKTQPPGTPWTEGNLWHHNWDQTKLTDYRDVWFAAKVINAHWVYTHDRDAEFTPASWLYVHLQQTGKSEDGYTLWKIETSIGGYVCTTFENQSGRAIDDNRPTNSIARLLWDEGFGSVDGTSIMIYNFLDKEDLSTPLSIYSTEVLGIKIGA